MNVIGISLSNKELKQTIYERLKEYDPMSSKDYSITDDINAGKIFSEIFKDTAVYNTTAKSWMVYNGVTWKTDSSGVEINRLGQLLQRSLLAYIDMTIPDKPNDSEKEFKSFVKKLGNQQNGTRMIEEAKANMYINADMLDANTDLFNCKNGVFNLKDYTFREHRADDFMSKVSNVVYDPKANSQEWDHFMSGIMQDSTGTVNNEKKEYLQRLCGYALTADNSQEEAYLIYGCTTRNGKSTFLETVGRVFGDYGMNIDPDTLAQKDKNTKSASGDIARLNGCRFLHCSEPPKRMLFNCALLKTLLGRDKITARNIYEREQEFTPIFKLFINTNFLPAINDDTLFASNRLWVITFDRHFSDQEQDRGLKNRLIKEECIAGVFNWMIDGLKAYRSKGTEPPESVKEATAQYRAKSDKVGSFIKECLEHRESSAIQAGVVYDCYSDWCKKSGYGIESKGNFFDELRTKKLLSESATIDRVTVRNVIKGYQLTTEETFRY